MIVAQIFWLLMACFAMYKVIKTNDMQEAFHWHVIMLLYLIMSHVVTL